MDKNPLRNNRALAKKAARKTTGPLKAVRRSRPNNIAHVTPGHIEREKGPLGWFIPAMEGSYTRLEPVDQAPAAAPVSAMTRTIPQTGSFRSALQPGRGQEVLARQHASLWRDRLAEYQRRKSRTALLRTAMAPSPTVPGAVNWAPLGPSVVMNGQAVGLPPVAGRVGGIAIAPGAQIVYVASANGGVFRSNDGGVTWDSLMDGFDLDPTEFASTSLACGAIAIDPHDPNRVYVGTGEGDTYGMFSSRIVNALPAYRGIGPVRSDDGGSTWHTEPSTPDLAGQAFFALAVDPTDREHVFGATSAGLFERTITDGSAQWQLRRPEAHSSVIVAAAAGVPHYFAAEWGKGVLHSTDGASWADPGSRFPTSGIGRIALAAQPGNAAVLYAFVSKKNGAVDGVYRLDGITGQWISIENVPDVLPVDRDGNSQGDYDLAITVDPVDVNLVYLGGSYFNDGNYWPGSIWRCQIQPSDSGYTMQGASIGVNAHADIHTLVHSPGDSDSLWVGCDGGVFLNRDPRGTGIFKSRNNGLSCLCSNFFAQHPTDPGILFCGLQDNGTARASGGPIWKHVSWGDGGYCVINWNDPQNVIVFADGVIYRATDGGQDHDSWTPQKFDWVLMTEPIVTTPYNAAKPAEASLVAMANGPRIRLSTNFGQTWLQKTIPLPTNNSVYSLVFATATRLFAGTTGGEVFRADQSGAGWTVTRVDDVGAGKLPLRGLISDIGVDWNDSTAGSVYIAFGGVGDYRHVWHFDGTKWEARSGAPGSNTDLLDVEHNAVAVDPTAPNNVYVGADIGVWHSSDNGLSWQPLSNGLPDAPVFDLQIHPTKRLLRASTHGRGLYELAL